MKSIPLIFTSALLTLALASCGNGTQTAGQAEYIGLDAAKAVALENAGVQEASATFSTAGLDKRNGIDYYDVEFTAGGKEYEYNIDAVTGVVIDHNNGDQSVAAAAPSPSASPTASPAASPAATPVATPAATPVATPVATPAATPAVQTTTQTQTTGSITAEQAKAKALAHAGLSASQVTFVKAHLDWDDGRQVYDVEFYTADYKEYDYEIDVNTGAVLSYDYDAEYYTPPQTSGGSSQTITAEQAKTKALSQVPGATSSDIFGFKTDYDDGRIQYEGKIIYNGMEYEFEIDGYSGSIREWDAEPFGW